MASNLQIEVAEEEDFPRLMDIFITSFADIPFMDIMFGDNTPENRIINSERHLMARREHNDEFPSVPVGIKCVHTNPTTGEKTIIGFAEWFVWDRERTPEEYMKDMYLQRMPYLAESEEKEKAKSFIKPYIDARKETMGGRAFGLLVNMVIDPAWRRRGAATMCVRWGMDKCRELGLPAYLEATEEGRKAYESMGWEMVEGNQQMYPAMMWFPPGVERL